VQVLGALAAAMSFSDSLAIPTPSCADLGEAVATWLAEHQPFAPTETAAEQHFVVSAESAKDICRHAVACGILVQSPDTAWLTFASTPTLAACVAIRLYQQDDGLSRLSPHLLRSQYTLPVLLWAGITQSPSDLAQRLLRLADTPETTAARAGLASADEVWPRAVSLALAAGCEGLAQRLACPQAAAGDATHLSAQEQHLRDLLDAALADVTDEAVPRRLVDALERVCRMAGAELAANATDLARDVRLSRLVRAQLVTVLGLLGSADARVRLAELLGEEDTLVRQATHDAIRRAGTQMLHPLRDAFEHPDERVREQAAQALAQFGEDAVDEALSALTTQTSAGRVTAARALHMLRSPRAEQALIAHLDDETMQVREAAARALGPLGTSSAIAALARHASARDPALRAAIADALGQSGSPDALTTLEPLLRDTDGRVRAAAASALGLLGDDRALDWLHAHRQDPDPQAHSAVASALRRLGRS
jgi:HEAT repeat protein